MYLRGRGKIVRVATHFKAPSEVDDGDGSGSRGAAPTASWTIHLKGTFVVETNGTGP